MKTYGRIISKKGWWTIGERKKERHGQDFVNDENKLQLNLKMNDFLLFNKSKELK